MFEYLKYVTEWMDWHLEGHEKAEVCPKRAPWGIGIALETAIWKIRKQFARDHERIVLFHELLGIYHRANVDVRLTYLKEVPTFDEYAGRSSDLSYCVAQLFIELLKSVLVVS